MRGQIHLDGLVCDGDHMRDRASLELICDVVRTAGKKSVKVDLDGIARQIKA